MKATDAHGLPVAGRSLVVPVKFEPSVLKPAHIMTNPDWLRQPTQQEAVDFIPAAARGEGGKTVIECVVSNRGLLDDCSVVKETPPGHGFGGAALAMSQLFEMRPMTVDGLPVGGGKVDHPCQLRARARFARRSRRPFDTCDVGGAVERDPYRRGHVRRVPS